MADKIDLSLDDIIKINKKNKDRSNKPKATTRNTNAKVLKSRIRPKIQPQQQQSRDSGPTMLHVANLHFGVSDKDLKELFEEIGKIKKAVVHYDKSGRSMGTAEVIFWSRDDATRAIKTYNQRILDGRPMNITLVPSRTTTVNHNNGSNATRGIGIKKGSGIQKRSPQKAGGRNQSYSQRSPKKGGGSMNNKGPRRQGTKKPVKKEISAEELDKDLDAYTNNNKMNVD
uniref:RNA and export factor-binding protein 2 n=1 Tax=Aceria tosichella TaxID=561515 RepID=A0A6G1SNY4_9ACAR